MRRSVRAVSVMAVLASMAVQPATAAQRPETPSPWSRAPSPAEAAPAALWRTIHAGAPVEDVLAARARLLAAPEHLGGSGATAASEHELSLGSPRPVGDLDGDGADDVLALEEFICCGGPLPVAGSHADGNGIAGMSGVDGSVLWSAEFGYLDIVLPADLDGDGDMEVVFLRTTTEYGPVLRVDQRLEAIDGADGALLWEHELTSTILTSGGGVYAGVGTTGVASEYDVAAVTDLVVAVDLMPDADGDGGTDVMLGTWDLVQGFAYAYGVGGLGTGQAVARFTAETLSGSDGAALGTTTATARDMPWGTASPDLDGDGAGDVVLTIPPAELRATSITGEQHWSTQAPAGVVTVPGDMDGDGTADIAVLQIFDDWWYIEILGIAVHAGADGASLWEAYTEGYGGFWFGPSADAGTGMDLMVYSWDEGLQVESWSGADGTPIWTRALEAPPGEESYVFICTCPDDLNGDGPLDLLFATEVWTGDEYLLDVSMLDGTNGLTVWTSPVPDWWALPIPALGDVDGDGARDLVSFVETWDEMDGFEVEAVLRSGTDYIPLWSFIQAATNYAYFGAFFGADLDDDGIDEIVTELWIYGEEDEERMIRAYAPSGMIWTT